MAELNMTWEEKLKKTEAIQKEREEALAEMGIALQDQEGRAVGVMQPKKTPHLVNLNEDPLMSECLLYYIKDGTTKAGSGGDIQLNGEFILEKHCTFVNGNGVVSIVPNPDSQTFVNGRLITEPEELRTGSRIILGNNHVFRFTNPEQARAIRAVSPTAFENPRSMTPMGTHCDSPLHRGNGGSGSLGGGSPASFLDNMGVVDWSFAQNELLKKTGRNISTRQEYEEKIIELERKLEEDRAEAEGRLEAQRMEYENRLGELEVELERKKKEEELVVLEEKEERITELEHQLVQKAEDQQRIENQKRKYEEKLEELEKAMVQRSAREEDSLVSQRMEYEKMLSQQRGLYGEKMSELEKLDSQRKEYEAELEMLQEQKKSYEAKMEEYEALQLQKKNYEAKLSELESALVKEIQSERTASEEILELQRKELMTKLEQLGVAMTLRQKEEEMMVVREKDKRISELEDNLRSKSVAEQALEQQKQEKKKRMDELEKSLAAVEEELSLKRTEHSTSMTEQKKQFEALIEQQRKEYDSNVQELESIRSEKDNYEAKLDKFRAQKQVLYTM
ncbi:Kinesin-like protein unc-104 [Geodia barretti]|uniref:Kinesin-like protein unc-104 n=1 Tax=Geodia barretti TaxID=519541 RepID=A0AA35WE52_GEOBA|nr:Kinesin-like protein unc-104 [Geodia barretti]